MDQPDPTPADDSVAPTTTVTPAAGGGNHPTVPPFVVDGPGVTSVQLLGSHRQARRLVLTFDRPLDPGRAQDLHNYELLALPGSGRAPRIKTTVYDAAAQTVTLIPVHRLNLHKRFQLTVVGTGPSGVTDVSGNLLDGQKTGHAGSDFVTVVGAASRVR
jgi:hypothetical protein